MTALSIQQTYPIFTDIDGQPLENGYIYIGTANADPQNSPISIYWDAGLTQSASQPIRTIGGYPVNSGTPARLYVNSDYSIRVKNKKGATIYSAAASTERYGGRTTPAATIVATATDTFTVPTYTPGGSMIVSINGLEQELGYAYTETNPTTITFSEALEAGDRITIRYAP